MLTIRPKQIESLAYPGLKEFILDQSVYVANYWGEEIAEMQLAYLEPCVRTLALSARKYGVVSEYDTARFIDIAFALKTLNWYEKDWARETLTDASLAPRHKMNILWEIAGAMIEED